MQLYARERIFSAAALALALAIGGGCTVKDKGDESGKQAKRAGPNTLAQVAGEPIEAEDLANQINEMSLMSRRKIAQSDRLLGQQLQRRVEQALVLAVARERGYDRDPRIQAMVRDNMVRMVKEDLNRTLTLASITDAEVQAYYKANPAEFSTPLRLHARHILFSDQQAAQKALARIRAQGKSEQGFIKLVRELSQDRATKARGGDLGLLTRPMGRVPPRLFNVIKSLEQPGDISEPVQTQSGWHVVRLTSRKDAELRPLELVKLQARIAVLRQKRSVAYQQLLRELEGRYPVKRFPARLSQVKQKIKLQQAKP